jgi:ketosteroid isomerase-like protein
MTNTEIIEKFYHAFSRLDSKQMNDCYSDDIIFSDPIFGILNSNEVRNMWEMLCNNAKEFSLSYNGIEELDTEYITCNWQATYVVSATNRKVTNKAKAYLRMQDGKIIEHSDAFRLSIWIAKAFGIKGILLGWTGYMKRKVQQESRKKLLQYMAEKNIAS